MFDRIIRDRMEFIEPLIRQGAVLDVGCVDARPEREGSASRLDRKPNLLLRRIAQVNPDTTGLDVDAPGVEALVAQGYRAVCGDAQSADLGIRFDAIVAGEVIEHLENPGQFLHNMRRHLSPAGRLILSTCNPFYAAQQWRIWRHGRPGVHEGHVAWFDPVTLTQLLHRTGFEVLDGAWVRPPRSLLKTWKSYLRPYFCQSFICASRARTSSPASP